MKRVNVDGVQFRLVGASGSAKDGKFYAVEAKYERAIAERFLNWPQAAITYFGVLVSPCKVRIEASDVRVIVVKDHEFGTNDCRGWISRSLFRALQERSRASGRDLPGERLYQFRLAFDSTQAKGACKVMEDDVAEFLGADIILPESSVKPEYKGPSRFLDLFRSQTRQLEVRTYRGPIVFGIRDVSETREFESSYTLLEHASWETLKSEILPHALSQVQKLKTAAGAGELRGPSGASRNVSLSAAARDRRERRLRIHEPRSDCRRGGSESRSHRLSGQASVHQSAAQQAAGAMDVQALHGRRIPNAGVCSGGRRDSGLARRSGYCGVGLAAAGLCDHVASVRPRSGGALSDPDVRRLTALSTDIRSGKWSARLHAPSSRRQEFVCIPVNIVDLFEGQIFLKGYVDSPFENGRAKWRGFRLRHGLCRRRRQAS